MRDLIDRETAVRAVRVSLLNTESWMIGERITDLLNSMPVVMRMQEESYSRLVGKKAGK